MNLLIDNSYERAAILYNRWSEEEKSNTIWARTTEEAISFFEYDYLFSTIYLEHDLDQGQLNYDSPLSGMEIVRWFEKYNNLDKFKDTEFIVHTLNIRAGIVMIKRLRNLNLNSKLIPFGLTKELY